MRIGAGGTCRCSSEPVRGHHYIKYSGLDMARTAKTTRAPGRSKAEPAPKKRIGRPVGSKNRTPSKAKAAPVAAAKRTVAKKVAAPAAPKLNKAELEHQVIKLERTIARLRKQNADLKQTAREDAIEAPKAAAVPVVAPDIKPKRASTPKTRRSPRKAAEPETAVSDAEDDDAHSED
ncbi:MAG: hypothetical protein ACRYG8_08915 [Janthinobacterium lividum]